MVHRWLIDSSWSVGCVSVDGERIPKGEEVTIEPSYSDDI